MTDNMQRFIHGTTTTEIHTLSLRDALPISVSSTFPWAGTAAICSSSAARLELIPLPAKRSRSMAAEERSEEHTSELQSHVNLVCRLLPEKKNKYMPTSIQIIVVSKLQIVVA